MVSTIKLFPETVEFCHQPGGLFAFDTCGTLVTSDPCVTLQLRFGTEVIKWWCRARTLVALGQAVV